MENIYLVELYDYYGSLFTEKQRHYFEDYYFENLTLQEIAENYQISRNAIHKTLKDIAEKLNYYENCLNLYQKRDKIYSIIDELDKDIQDKIKELV